MLQDLLLQIHNGSYSDTYHAIFLLLYYVHYTKLEIEILSMLMSYEYRVSTMVRFGTNPEMYIEITWHLSQTCK